MKPFNYKKGFFVAVFAFTILSSFAGGYAYAVVRFPDNTPRCDLQWTGQIPPSLLPAVQQQYPAANATDIYAVYLCANGTTDAVKNCAHVTQEMIPDWLRSSINISSLSIYSCRVGP